MKPVQRAVIAAVGLAAALAAVFIPAATASADTPNNWGSRIVQASQSAQPDNWGGR